MNNRRITSHDVARHAGVSQTTVSFVLNGKRAGNISAETSARVWQAVEELGYVPNATARSLARGYSSNIALALINPHQQVFVDDYVPNIITGMTQVVRDEGFRVLLELVSATNPTNTVRDLVVGKEVAGLVLLTHDEGPAEAQLLDALMATAAPLITISHTDADIHCVLADNLSGIRQMTAHLIGLGHQQIACISYAPRHGNNEVRRRSEAFLQVMTDHELSVPGNFFVDGAFDPQTGYHAMQSLLALPARPSAVLCLNDTMAIGAIAAVQDAGLGVPQDIAVVGFDDIRMAAFTNPPLTTIRAPEIQLGKQAGMSILDLIRGVAVKPKRQILATELVVRSSCGANLAPFAEHRSG